jgi:hypothetical protein
MGGWLRPRTISTAFSRGTSTRSKASSAAMIRRISASITGRSSSVIGRAARMS